MDGQRIALLFATSGHSGVDRVIGNLLPEFASTDHTFDLLVIGGHGPDTTDLHFPNIRIRRLPVSTKKLVVPPLAGYLLRERPQALLTANHPLNRAALLARRITGIPARVTIRMGMSLSAQSQALGARRGNRLLRSMRRWYPQANAVIAPSEGVGRDLVNLAGVAPEHLHMIRNPILNAAFYDLMRARAEHPWLDDDGPPVVLAVGSLEPRKDIATLLRAFAKLRQVLDCRLLVLGEGGERGRLQALAQELEVEKAVDLHGHIANPYPYMRRASVLALTSKREGASAVIVEALACGTPVVSTDCPSGPSEVLGPLDQRALVPIGDHEELAMKLLGMIQDPPSQETLTALAQDHDASISAQKYIAAVLG